MKVTKKDLPKKQVEIIVEVTPIELKPYLEQATKKISQDVNVPGFRKGNVPYDVLKQNVGESTIYEEAFYEVVNKTLPKILVDEKINFIGQPKVDAEKIAPGNPLVYKAVISLMPTVKLGNYKTLKAQKKKVEVKPDELEKTLEDLRKMHAQEKIVLRAAKKGDKVEVDFTIKLAGAVIEGGQDKKYPIVVGENKFIPGFEDALLGMKAGDEKDFKLTFPKDYFKKELQGRETDAHVKVNNVNERSLPKLDDNLAQGFNFKDLVEMKQKIEDNIKAELNQKEDERFELALLEEIIDMSEFDEFSDALLESETAKMMNELKYQIEDSGGNMDEYFKSIKKTEKEVKKDFQPKADKRLKTALIAKEVGIQEKVTVSDKEVEDEIKKILETYKEMPEMNKQFESEEYKNYLKNMLVNRKVFAILSSFAEKSK
ncbi:MAG: trigger factor [Candidatus Nealsonbacteria bacterium]